MTAPPYPLRNAEDEGRPIDLTDGVARLAKVAIEYSVVADRKSGDVKATGLDEGALDWAQSQLANKALIEAINLLRGIPGLDHPGAVRPLIDIMVAFGNLELGLDAPLFDKNPNAKRGNSRPEDNFIKVRAAICYRLVRILKSAGAVHFDEQEICHLVRSSFEEAIGGLNKDQRGGRNGFGDRTIASWASPRGVIYKAYGATIDQGIVDVQATSEWPWSEASAGREIRKIAQSVRVLKKRN